MASFGGGRIRSWCLLPAFLVSLEAGAQGAMLTSSVYAGVEAAAWTRLVSGALSCADSNVPAACSFSAMVYNMNDVLGSVQGSASAVPSLYAIDHAASVTGFTYNLRAQADAQASTWFDITGATGSGFVQYLVSGDASVGPDDGIHPSFVSVRHNGLPEETVLIPPFGPQPRAVSLTSQLYPVQFGEPFSFSWAASMSIWGSGADQVRDKYMRLRLEFAVFDAQKNAVADARLQEVPEPAGVGLVLSGLGAMGVVVLRQRRSRCR